MATELALLFALVIISSALSSPSAGNGDRTSNDKVAQYCLPQDEIPDAPRIYC
jgi:hypothetical protein